MRIESLLAPATVLAFVGCGPEPMDLTDECRAIETAMAEDLRADTGERTWRHSVEEIIRTAPPDSIVNAAIKFGGANRPRAADAIHTAGGEIVYWFRTISWVHARVPASGLAQLYAQDWVLGISIGRRSELPNVRSNAGACGG